MALRNNEVVTTTVRTVRSYAGVEGTEGPYYSLIYGPGEPYVRRIELAPEAKDTVSLRSILHFGHVSDIHTVDVESPGRFEFMERYSGGPEVFHLIVPSFRPQEALNPHATDMMLRTLNALGGRAGPGSRLQLVVSTGDNTDNSQTNELERFMALMSGAVVTPGSGGPAYEGVQSATWGDPAYWRPDPEPDAYKERWGFPTRPGLLQEAMQPFRGQGLRVPWLSTYGNHDALALGTAVISPSYGQLLTGNRKAKTPPAGFDPARDLVDFIPHPESMLSGPAAEVTPDPGRHAFDRRAYMEAHFQAGGEPAGHGFTAENRTTGSAYYVHDRYPSVRLIVLDTVNRGGHYEGSVGVEQLNWLEQRLVEVHSRYYDTRGRQLASANEDRLVVVLSHHGLATLVNPLVDPDTSLEADTPRALGPAVEAMLHRFPNVVLMVNGHTHRHTVRPRPDTSGRTGGFWEVTTGSLLDWPNQARLIELVVNRDHTLSILCTMLDHAAPPNPSEATAPTRLASLHRELAANDPHAGVRLPSLRGEHTDRNVELVLPCPFDLR